MPNGIELKPCPFCGSDRVRVTKPTIWQAWCMDCKAIGATRLTEQEAAKAWNARADGWILCDERMPEDDERVLGNITITVNTNITKPKQRTIFAKYDRVFGWTTANGYPIIGKITHWMPLPNPPKKGESE